ncbi:MAG: N-acetylglucosamine-6-phosphate deacetylase [Lachnospiraceae bacterium]|nr:N-acetylglucosamine-6-phosphate deacetylase [Lachnospiraceae bacterium]
MIIKNASVYTEDGQFAEADVFVSGDIIVQSIEELSSAEEKDVVDAAGMYLIPGLTDIHFHGCMGADLSDGTVEAVETIAAYQASVGVTTIVPATMTVEEQELLSVCRSVREYRNAQEGICGCGVEIPVQKEEQAILCGIHLEGPFLSAGKAGAQNPAFIRKPDAQLLDKFQEESGGLVRICSLAPEEEGATELIRDKKDEMIFSLAHTMADYDTACNAFEAGASQVTHLFNAMPAFLHRMPGVIGAAMDKGAYAELICDGIHVHPAAVRGAMKLFGEDRIIFISDSMRATGLADGRYLLGGLEVSVTGKKALLADESLAGSVTNLADCMRTAVKDMGIPLETAVKCAAVNPAKRVGLFDKCGSITAGKWANLVLLNKEDLSLAAVFVKGKRIV